MVHPDTTNYAGATYVAVFIDDYSRWALVKTIGPVTEIHYCFGLLLTEVRAMDWKEITSRVRRFRCNNGTAYSNGRFKGDPKVLIRTGF